MKIIYRVLLTLSVLACLYGANQILPTVQTTCMATQRDYCLQYTLWIGNDYTGYYAIDGIDNPFNRADYYEDYNLGFLNN